jgi:SAM-dependent methyltransferase
MENINNIKIINEHQKQTYESEDKRVSKELIEIFSDTLEKFKNRNTLKILDIGGGSGYFALAIQEYFNNQSCEVIVVDATHYDTWNLFADKVTFLNQSVDELNQIFTEQNFDLVFANRVFHHFIRDSWKSSINGMSGIMKSIAFILKPDGYFCITDHFFDGLVYDEASSRIIYMLSSCKWKPVIAVCNKAGVDSAGVGVCFLSRKLWVKLLFDAGFEIEKIIEQNWPKVKQWYIKIFFLNKRNNLDNVMVAGLRLR